MLFTKRKGTKYFFQMCLLMHLIFGLTGCTKSKNKINIYNIITLVIEEEAIPLPPPSPPPQDFKESDLLNFNKKIDSIYGLKRKVKLVPEYFELDFSKLPSAIPSKYLIQDGITSRASSINVALLDRKTRHSLIAVDYFSNYKKGVDDGIYMWTFQFSKIFFNKDYTAATLILDKRTSSSGSTIFLGLEKINGEWKINYRKELEIS